MEVLDAVQAAERCFFGLDLARFCSGDERKKKQLPTPSPAAAAW
jgi:hypothetical protein